MTKLLVSVYKSSKKDEMYLYTKKQDQLSKVPEALMTQFGMPTKVLDMLLTPEKKLDREDSMQVLSEIQLKGFFLQMPPANPEDWLQEYQDWVDQKINQQKDSPEIA